MQARTLISIKNSALWAAYADALGFISELADPRLLEKRINSTRVTKMKSWKRRVGGRFGVDVVLPSGCYSDDTQLRLSTCRAIRGDGHFDVEAFAKVELPVWLSYALGAGRGSRSAALSLTHQNVNWFSNFFNNGRSHYTDCGGNGAAMRIQPHVWSASDRSKPETFILDVVKNAICTHGHPRGILGAVFHALCLAMTLDRGHIAGPDEWAEAVAYFPKVATLIRRDTDLSMFWLRTWEDKVGGTVEAVFDQVQDECFNDILSANAYLTGERSEDTYAAYVDSIGGREEEQRGSGIKTAIIASFLSWLYREESPSEALQVAANLLLSDTDTIGTMAGAILGCLVDKAPDDELMDRNYIEAQTDRLYSISARSNLVESFTYPDLAEWQPPKAMLDVVGIVGDKCAVAGLGIASGREAFHDDQSKDSAVWQWLVLEFGQSVLVKRRRKLRPLPLHNLPMTKQLQQPKHYQALRPVSRTNEFTGSEEHSSTSNVTLHKLTTEAIESGFNETLIGKHLLSLAVQPDGIEKAIAYAAIIAKARLARLSPRNNKS